MNTLLIIMIAWAVLGIASGAFYNLDGLDTEKINKHQVTWWVLSILGGPFSFYHMCVNLYLTFKIRHRNSIPVEGKCIKITWLPESGNGSNARIGAEGVVWEVYADGSFSLKDLGSILLVEPKYKFEYISAVDYHESLLSKHSNTGYGQPCTDCGRPAYNKRANGKCYSCDPGILD